MSKTTKIGAPSIWVIAIALAGLTCVGAVVYSYVTLQQGAEKIGNFQLAADQMRSTAQKLDLNARPSASADQAGLNKVGELLGGFERSLTEVQAAGLNEQVSLVEVNWLPVKKAAQTLIELTPQIVMVNEVVRQYERDSRAIHSGFSDIAAALSGAKVSNATVIAAQKSLLLTERIERNLERINAGAEAAVGEQLLSDSAELVVIAESLAKGNSVLGVNKVAGAEQQQALEKTLTLLGLVATSAESVVTAAPAMNKAAAARQTILDSSAPLNDSLAGLTVAVAAAKSSIGSNTLNLLLAAPLVLAGLLLFVLFGGQRRQSARVAKGVEQINETLTLIAAGDLTVRLDEDNPLISEVAKEINFSTARQAELVKNIRRPFDVAVDGIHKIGATARGQVEKAKELTSSVANSAAAATEMVRASEEIKASTAEAAQTSERNSAQVAQGYELTQDMSRASADVRESVQETSKSAKRQGELIQSVTAAAEYIQALNTKISVVAINTRIEAEKAGEYGRPFLGIADSIAELLREAEEEGRKIISEVRTLQNLSAENLSSMENTVGTVVTILEYIERLVSSLEEINEGSTAIGSIVKSVDEAAAKSAVSALRMNSAMAEIRERNLEIGKFSETSQKGVNGLQVSMRDVADNINQFKVDANAVAQKPRVAELESVQAVKASSRTDRDDAGNTLDLASKRKVSA